MNILVTGARAPISADYAKCLAQLGHKVYLTDSMRWPVAKFSPWARALIRLPAPAKNFPQFEAALTALVSSHDIDVVIPTSEEVFWLAQVQALGSKLRAPTFEQLKVLHHKGLFAKLAQKLGAGAPHAFVLHSRREALAFVGHHNSQEYVLKPCYSRFGHKVKLSPSSSEVLELDFRMPWLAQTRVTGQEVCVYAVAHQGRVCLLSAYLPKYRIADGASVYFEPIEHPALLRFVANVCKEMNLSGQVSFDVMLTSQGLVALECNPRGTSGVHLMSQYPQAWTNALLHGMPASEGLQFEPRMLGLAMALYQGAHLLTSQGRADFRRAKDALANANIPWYGGLIPTVELMVKALVRGMPVLDASTEDFEWNGQ